MQVKRTVEEVSDYAAKKPRYDDNAAQKLKEQFVSRFEVPKKSSIVSNIDR